MLTLGIETSCDETCAAIVKNGTNVLSNVIASQIDIHALTGGVVPEVAARAHVLEIVPIVKEALNQAQITVSDLDQIAVTQTPGLIGSLAVGISCAQSMASFLSKPLIFTNHIHGHVMANWLQRDEKKFHFPILVLTVSGGHNELILMHDYTQFEVLGSTLDDAAGEAFDKVARMLGLNYPGGPQIALLAQDGDENAFDLPLALMAKESLDFSFSGLKTAVLNLVKSFSKEDLAHRKADIAASFQKTVAKIFAEKILRAVKAHPHIRMLHLTGGVSANLRVRAELQEVSKTLSLPFLFPEKISYCTDNAAMIAACGYFQSQFKQNL
jgi:N6-L-threonylcarbamoyladenine synthase